MQLFRSLLAIGAAAFALSAQAADLATLSVHVQGIEPESSIPDANALCVPTANGKSGPGQSLRPSIAWSPGPAGTKSYVVIVSDPDVPQDLTQADKPQTIPADAPRQTFYHWVQLAIPADVARIGGSDETAQPKVGIGAINDVTAANPFGYGGPCPPWNDLRVHHYHFQVLALDVASLTLPKGATGKMVANVLPGHVLARGEVVGTYTTNAQLLHAK
ncbi:MAG: YbhB/YbcL family Raf kinase inhibitor-like protein [Alphaproteobacteria bacterium]